MGQPRDRRMQAAANRRGIDLPSRARQICLDDFSSFDLVLTMDDDNLAAVRGLAQEAGAGATATITPMLHYARNFSETRFRIRITAAKPDLSMFSICSRMPAPTCSTSSARRRRPGLLGDPERNSDTRASITASMVMPSVTSSTASSA